MEVSVPCPRPASQELRSNSASVTTPNIPTHYTSGDLCMNDLKMSLNEFGRIEDIGISTSCMLVGNNNNGDVMEDGCKDPDESIDNLPGSKSSVEEMLFEEKEMEDYKTSEINDCDKFVSQSCSPPKSLSTPLKLASAMKGNREKKGTWPEKLSVTWAPDVYDPIPTSVSHYPSSKSQQCRNNGRKYGKKKQKGGGKSAQGGKGKDKKQTRKNSGNTATKPMSVEDDHAASFSEPEAGIIGFNVAGADPFCGSSFLKESFNNMHFPVAEPTR